MTLSVTLKLCHWNQAWGVWWALAYLKCKYKPVGFQSKGCVKARIQKFRRPFPTNCWHTEGISRWAAVLRSTSSRCRWRRDFSVATSEKPTRTTNKCSFYICIHGNGIFRVGVRRRHGPEGYVYIQAWIGGSAIEEYGLGFGTGSPPSQKSTNILTANVYLFFDLRSILDHMKLKRCQERSVSSHKCSYFWPCDDFSYPNHSLELWWIRITQ